MAPKKQKKVIPHVPDPPKFNVPILVDPSPGLGMSLQEELLHIMPQEKDSLAVDVSNIWGDNINPNLITPEENESNKSTSAAEDGKYLKKKPRITKRKKTPSPKK
ncbi:hypothetical protein CASFOL_001805 [Castilleja foliolosa]|uniref:Uncharacterized protein n=1 Tax=Castilleja foliolosa TaxID=1961234 RepID=A0ABD3ED34_9LAMI